MDLTNIYDLIGITGAALILFGLYRNTSGTWTDKSLWYELDHFAGSILLAIYVIHNEAYIGIVIHVAYAFAAFWGLSSYVERRTKLRKTKKK